ncbi:DUF58 domain-containing protein [Sediminivirga luteola]|uniref:DUF58 domain-containing protein n=1 Tax=Sediminivirga luteola TaxID=1774748 RepID=UPI001F58F7C8|nr:DUF58 domain-containing protein [Sediminivirga luteola]MCI2266924.1 DUF58 domain-containing protein [Sediminivirga luteola]
MRLTFSGWAFLVAGGGLIAAAYLAALPGLLPVGALVAALPVLSLLLAGLSARALQISFRVHAPELGGQRIAEVGRPLEVELLVVNRHLLPTQGERLQLDLSPAFGADVSTRLPRIAPGRSRRISHQVTPELRGVYQLGGGTLTIFGPFTLCRITRRLEQTGAARRRSQPGQTAEVAVSAAVSPMHLPGHTSSSHALEESSRLSVGNATRDFHAREYVPGDDLRFVHWTTTARMGELMVRNESEEHVLSAVLVADLRASAYHGEEAFETMALGLTSAAAAFLRRGYEVTVLRPRAAPVTLHGQQSMSRLRRLSAQLEWREDESLPRWPASQPRPSQLVVCCGSRDQALMDLVPRRHRVRAVVLAANEVTTPADSLRRAIFRMPMTLPARWRSLQHEAAG